jgi:hypothetical protein
LRCILGKRIKPDSLLSTWSGPSPLGQGEGSHGASGLKLSALVGDTGNMSQMAPYSRYHALLWALVKSSALYREEHTIWDSTLVQLQHLLSCLLSV